MGVFSRVARKVGKVVSVAGGDGLVERARSVKHRIDELRGGQEDEEEFEVPPWPDVLVPVWDRGHDLLSSGWPATANLMNARILAVGAEINQAFMPIWPEGAQEMAGHWTEEGQRFIQVWLKAGEAVTSAWETAIKASSVVEAEGILDSAIQDQWRVIREGLVPIRLALRQDLKAAGTDLGLTEDQLKAAVSEVDGAWGVTETTLSERFLDGGGYLVSMVREAARGQAPTGELIDVVQDFSAKLEGSWRERLQVFETSWVAAAKAMTL